MKTEWFSWFCKKLLSLWCQSNSICDSCILVVVSFHQKLNFVEEKWHHQIDLLHRLWKQGLHSKLGTKLAYMKLHAPMLPKSAKKYVKKVFLRYCGNVHINYNNHYRVPLFVVGCSHLRFASWSFNSLLLVFIRWWGGLNLCKFNSTICILVVLIVNCLQCSYYS